MKKPKTRLIKKFRRSFEDHVGFIVLLLSAGLAFLLLSFVMQVRNGSVSRLPVHVIFSPHLDDATLSLGGFISKQKGKVTVVTVFSGRPAMPLKTEWDNRSGFSDSDEALAGRLYENGTVLSVSGVVMKNLSYLDNQYRVIRYDRSIEESLVRDIKSIISSYRGKSIYVYGPAEFGEKITHPDHKIVHDAFVKVAREDSDPAVEFLIYEDFPYARSFAFLVGGPVSEYLERAEGLGLSAVPVFLSVREIAEKVKAIYGYRSQVEAFRRLGSDIGVLADKYARDRCKSLPERPYACEVVYRINREVIPVR